jgi:tetratricopeptide (TPR) repeat protein
MALRSSEGRSALGRDEQCRRGLRKGRLGWSRPATSKGAARAYRESLLETGREAAACFNLANVLADLGHTEAAAERYRQVVELDPQYAAAWNNLGRSLDIATTPSMPGDEL